MPGSKKGERRGGRCKGTPNKITADVRAAIALLAQRNVAHLEGWLQRGAKRDPLRAADVFARILEYHIPKLARTEVTAPDGKPPGMPTKTRNEKIDEILKLIRPKPDPIVEPRKPDEARNRK